MLVSLIVSFLTCVRKTSSVVDVGRKMLDDDHPVDFYCLLLIAVFVKSTYSCVFVRVCFVRTFTSCVTVCYLVA